MYHVLIFNSFFFKVRSELKKDKRTIEETLADIRAKKLKQDHRSSFDEDKPEGTEELNPEELNPEDS